MEVKCGKRDGKTRYGVSTNLSYGPWADRQRFYLQKFFYPHDHKTMEVTQQPLHNQRRKHDRFDFKMMTIGDVMFDILFTKDKVSCTVSDYRW